ncbi:MAG: phospho-N-acetylmuramoyl-pentapeptide-transferase [Candidatus Gracilibacteria bacterium]
MDLVSNLRHLALIFGSQISAFVLAIILAPTVIRLLHKYKCSKQIREIASTGESASIFQSLHGKKKGIPTMGGILIWGTVLIICVASYIPANLGFTNSSLIEREETYLPIFTLITTALLGAVDDYFNIRGLGKSKGLNIKPKFFWLTLFAAAGALWFYFRLGYDQIHLPGIGDFFIDWWYIPLFVLVITSTANAVNITDGLDGLAGGLLITAFGAFAIIAFAQGLFILAAFCAVIVGALIGFIWFNIFPAHFIMGDTGAISLGATLGVIAMMTDSVAVLPLIGFVFVIETLSVIIQITSKKLFGKKVFLIAPIHHHFEKKGWSEPNIVMRFWIIGAFTASLGLILGLLGAAGA